MLTPTTTDAVKTNTAPGGFTILDLRFLIYQRANGKFTNDFGKIYLKLIFT
jgi:hypothetical protein